MEFVASIALRTLLPKLAQLLQAEYKLQKSARKGIEDMYKELEAIDAFLQEVSKVPRDQLDEEKKIWAQEVRDLSYDMEDIVDTFMVEVKGPDASPSKTSFEKFFNKFFKMKEKVNKAMTRREVAKEIMDIKKRVVEVAARHNRYKFDNPAKETPLDPRITAQYTDAKKLVGIDDAKKEVITRLTKGDDDQQQERIISIAGLGGLGKTTLAKAVFDEIKGQFECSAFVSMSRNPDINKLLKGMLLQLRMKGDGDIPGAYLDVQTTELIVIIGNFLKNKRYLIVIDDIWDIGHWNMIQQALNIENNMGSRIIITTRKVGVADKVGGCYRLKPLTDENSGKLFYRRIFGKEKCPEQFYEISQKILKKCGGIPLAIITTSSLLANKSEKKIKEWYDVCDSIGLGLGSNLDLDSMRNILLLSYYDLPSHLKTCLLYLSIFPEDYEIEKGRLIWRWVAEGFVQREHEDQSFLECGENYFNELVNRSLIQPTDVVQGTPMACRVHDIVLDLIISLSKEECFITTISGDGKHSLESKPVRRLSLHDGTTGWLTINKTKLRSLTIFKPDPVVIDPTPSLPCCHLLRVLDLGDWRFEKPANLGPFLESLAHLQYLGLSNSAVGEIPIEIGKLLFLQTLDLYSWNSQLPSSLAGLTQLMCLRIIGPVRLRFLPDGLLKNLTSLEVLESVCITPECFAEELGHLTRLRRLDVTVCFRTNKDRQYLQAWGEAMAKALGKALGKLKKIESLFVEFNPCIAIFMDGSVEPQHKLYSLGFRGIETLPTGIDGASFRVLSRLNITVRHERREDIQILGTLPCLCYLSFKVLQRAKPALERCEVGPDAFPSAISFRFGSGVKVQAVVPSMFLGGAMPKLEDYNLRLVDLEDFCGSGAPYTIDDLALAHLPSLQSVTMWFRGRRPEDDKEVVRSVREKIEREAASHPNHPRLELKFWY